MSSFITPNVKRTIIWSALGLVLLCIGLMVLGWTVPRRAVYDMGVFGFRMLPFAFVAFIGSLIIPAQTTKSIATPKPSKMQSNHLQLVKTTPQVAKKFSSSPTYYDYMAFFHYPTTGKDSLGYYLDEDNELDDIYWDDND